MIKKMRRFLSEAEFKLEFFRLFYQVWDWGKLVVLLQLCESQDIILRII